MIELFKATNEYRGGKIDKSLDYLIGQQKRSLDTLIERESEFTLNVNGDHLLAGCIISLPDTQTSFLDYYNLTLDKDREIATALGITNSNNKGEVFEDEFYPGLNVIVLDRTPMDTFELIKLNQDNWMHINPVKALKTPLNWNGLNLPKNLDKRPHLSSLEDDYSVISINIAAIAAKWYFWNEYQKQLPFEERSNLYSFISRYLIPGIGYSQQDTFLINNFYQIEKGLDIPIDEYDNSRFLNDYGYKLRSNYAKFLSEFKNKLDVNRVLYTTPAISEKNIQATLPEINDYHNSANFWALFGAYSNWYKWVGLMINRDMDSHSDMRNRYKRVKRKINNYGRLVGPSRRLTQIMKKEQKELDNLFLS